jgi:ABC-type lipoprotein export system ATPase subunit
MRGPAMDELLVLSAIQKSYRRGERRLRVLTDVSLTVAFGEIAAVVGSRHEGKSTLLEIAAGRAQPDGGEVRFEGRALGSMRVSELERLRRDEIAWVHREGTGLEFEVLDYVALPLRLRRGRASDAQERAMAALERVGVQDVARRRWDELSNWERVLVAFARGIACEPRLMVVDDVIDGLGMSKTREAGDLLSSLVQDMGCGVLMSVSDPEAALAADRVWSFDRGALKLLSDQTADQANIITFPGGSVPQSRGFSGSGS